MKLNLVLSLIAALAFAGQAAAKTSEVEKCGLRIADDLTTIDVFAQKCDNDDFRVEVMHGKTSVQTVLSSCHLWTSDQMRKDSRVPEDWPGAVDRKVKSTKGILTGPVLICSTTSKSPPYKFSDKTKEQNQKSDYESWHQKDSRLTNSGLDEDGKPFPSLDYSVSLLGDHIIFVFFGLKK